MDTPAGAQPASSPLAPNSGSPSQSGSSGRLISRVVTHESPSSPVPQAHGAGADVGASGVSAEGRNGLQRAGSGMHAGFASGSLSGYASDADDTAGEDAPKGEVAVAASGFPGEAVAGGEGLPKQRTHHKHKKKKKKRKKDKKSKKHKKHHRQRRDDDGEAAEYDDYGDEFGTYDEEGNFIVDTSALEETTGVESAAAPLSPSQAPRAGPEPSQLPSVAKASLDAEPTSARAIQPSSHSVEDELAHTRERLVQTQERLDNVLMVLEERNLDQALLADQLKVRARGMVCVCVCVEW